MDAERLAVVLIALTALLAFAVSAASVADTGIERQPPDVDEDNQRDVGEPPGPPESPSNCLVGCGGARSVLAGLIGELGVDTLIGAGVAAVVLLAAYWLIAGRNAGGDPVAGEPTATLDAAGDARQTGTIDLGGDRPATNEVYRAWLDLRSALGGDGSLTPAEYRELARQRGYDDEAVAALTEVFRRVRYGQAGATSDREAAAREAIDAILADDASGDGATVAASDASGDEAADAASDASDGTADAGSDASDGGEST